MYTMNLAYDEIIEVMALLNETITFEDELLKEPGPPWDPANDRIKVRRDELNLIYNKLWQAICFKSE